jgi:hypothetical protein
LYDIDEECLVFGVFEQTAIKHQSKGSGVETQRLEDAMRKCLQHFFDTKTRRRKDTKFFNTTNLMI